MERFAEKMAGREDIWYATNIEICRYVEAARQLAYSADGQRVYNASAQPVWLEERGRLVCAQPGALTAL